MPDINDCAGVSFLIYGPSKGGKSTLANTAPAPRLILDAEGGTRFLKGKKVEWNPNVAPPEYDGTWETCIVYIRDFSSLSKTYNWLTSGKHPFKSVVLDSVSEAQQRCVDALVGTEQMKLQNWGELFRKMSSLIRNYRDLLIHPTNPLEAVIIIAMEKEENGKHIAYLQGQVKTTMPYYIDIVGYLRASANEETGEMQRMLLVAPHDNFESGDRTDSLPSVVVNPNISEMLAVICKAQNGE